MRDKSIQNQDTEPFRVIRNVIFSLLVSLMRKKPSLRRRVRLLAEREEWVTWVENKFGAVNFYWSREKLWNELHNLVIAGKSPHTVLEFGVAWGYATNYWISKSGKEIENWHGFDRFTGLPRAWRDLDAGAFSSDATPPNISDSRIVWHVGDVEQQLPLVTIDNRPKLILFDLDIYEPTEFAWLWLRDSLHTGDLLYFDEGFDTDERKIIEQYVINDFKLKVVGITHTAIAFELTHRNN